MSGSVFLGIDLGTSGVRGSCIDLEGKELASFQLPLELPTINGDSIHQEPGVWKQTAYEVIRHLSQQVKPLEITALAIDGTSSTVLLCDDSGNPSSPALMYNDQSCLDEAQIISDIAPTDCAAHGATSSLAKALFLLKKYPAAQHICHQADWLAGTLTGQYDVSDENNCLKMGYDLLNNSWPDWLSRLDIPLPMLPRVQVPGTVIGRVLKDVADELGLNPLCKIVSGTTDSIAAFIATGAKDPGDAVTSLGSTLVLKVVSEKPVFSPEFGIYSHRLGKQWLAGGASNSGGRVLSQHFTHQQLEQMTPLLKPEQSTGLDYYPLPATGERFPRNDPDLKSQLNPRPKDDLQFFQGMLEGIANIETEGYKQLALLGAPFPKKVFTTGGGSCNPAWAKIREQKLGASVITQRYTQASYGAALLAKQGHVTNN
jgi:sugar (pentulose or hexulose) kinase